MTIKGIVESVKVLKEGVGKNKDGKFIKVVVDGKEYVTFDTKFLEAVGLEGEFETHIKEYNGKQSTYIDLPKIKAPEKDYTRDIDQALIILKEGVDAVSRTLSILKDLIDDDFKSRGK